MQPDSLDRISAEQIAQLAGVSNSAVSNWAKRNLEFPKAVDEQGRQTWFDRAEVIAWLTRNRPEVERRFGEVAQRFWTVADHARGTAQASEVFEALAWLTAVTVRGGAAPSDLTRTPMELPASRALRLQALTRGDEGFVLSMAYSTQRGYGRTHAFVGELRIGMVQVSMDIPELGFAVEIGEVELTECETVNQFKGSRTEPAQFTRGYGLVFGQTERKAIAMALLDRSLRWRELGEDNIGAPAQDEEFVLMHADNVQATGFLEHIKLPHYVDFQSELELVRRLRGAATEARMPEAAE